MYKSFLQILAQTHRELSRQHNAQMRAANQAAREASRQADRARREFERAQLLSQKEKVRLHLELRNAQATLQNSILEEAISRLTNLLADSIGTDTFISFSQLRKVPQIPISNQTHWQSPSRRQYLRSIFPQNRRAYAGLSQAPRPNMLKT